MTIIHTNNFKNPRHFTPICTFVNKTYSKKSPDWIKPKKKNLFIENRFFGSVYIFYQNE
ncbi:hypothetical protein D068_cds02010 [Bacillus atrophaeus UCMB-5137]|nr:hypothetical protein D068_cds02010 [Bacillus atrophaeus UCMB-5137]